MRIYDCPHPAPVILRLPELSPVVAWWIWAARSHLRRRMPQIMAMQMGQQTIVDFDVPARMRDGTTLRANVYRPAGEGKWPVLLTRLPYGKDFPIGASMMDPAQVARRGYVVIVQDTRGRLTSEGEWVPFVNEALDGVDTIEWAAQLPYSNGSVGMYGISYFGFTQ